jgi:C-terminal processing protease CtpA/Prc
MRRVLPVFAAAALLATSVLPSATAASGLSSLETDELQTSYSLLSSEFYKKVDAQAVLDGVRTELISYLGKSGIKHPKVPLEHATDDATTNARLLDRVVTSVVSEYGPKLGSRELTYEAISGMLGSVHDKYTVFLNPKEYAELNEGLDGGNFSGVGISIGVDEKTKLLNVNEVIPDGPAEKAGVQSGDTIISVDGKSTKGLATEQDAKMLRGA